MKKVSSTAVKALAVLMAARRYIKLGLSVIPIPLRSKGPVISGWQHLRIALSDAHSYFKNACNIGVLLGEPSGMLIDIDLDTDEAIALAPHFLPDTACFGRQSKPASHYIYKATSDLATAKYQFDSTTIVEIRSTGCQTVFPPSTHPSGERVSWSSGSVESPTSIAPDDLKRKVGNLAAAALICSYWQNGARQDMTLALAGGLLRAGWTSEDVTDSISAICDAAGDKEKSSRLNAIDATAQKHASGNDTTGFPRLSEIIGEPAVSKIMDWLGLKDGTSRSKVYSMTDLGNSHRMVDQFGADIKYCHKARRWYIWNGKYWQLDQSGMIVRKAKKTLRSIIKETASITDDDQRKAMLQHIKTSENAFRVRSMIELAQSEDGISISPEEFDADNYLLNCQNGTLDLRTGSLLPHSREHLITRIIPVTYDPEAKCPKWKVFLNRIFAGDKKLIRFVQKAIGYSLTGNILMHCLFILYGTGRNGKSTLVNVIQKMLGEYGQSMRSETLLSKRSDGIPNDIARLKGARFVAAMEADRRRSLAEAQIKQLTGGDRITARFLRQEYFDFDPTHKIWLSVNHKPKMKDNDLAIWSRIRLIPFNVTIPPHEQNPNLTDELTEELPGILAWAVRGCLAWQKNGLEAPDAVKNATASYRQEMDAVQQFLDEECEIRKDAYVFLKHLHENYIEWCENNVIEPLSKSEFQSAIDSRDFRKVRANKGMRYYGLEMKDHNSSVAKRGIFSRMKIENDDEDMAA